MTSLTSTPQGVVPGARQGRSRAAPSYQRIARSATGVRTPASCHPAVRVPRWPVGSCEALSMHEYAITVIGHDRPGIIADVTSVLAGLGLNLTDSTMTLLRGHFAMTLICAGDVDAAVAAGALA